jgi:hypothetical protein
MVAYIVQVKALREGRRLRDDDHKRVQQAQGTALLFKMIRIHSDLHSIHRHIEDCFEDAEQKGVTGEPWQFVLPLANPPGPIHFSSEEMGMLLALKADEVFNTVVPMDTVHNSLSDAVTVLNVERRALTERLNVDADEVRGAVVSGVLKKDQMMALRPRMIEVNSLIQSIRAAARADAGQSREALVRLSTLFREKLALAYKLEFKDQAGVQG